MLTNKIGNIFDFFMIEAKGKYITIDVVMYTNIEHNVIMVFENLDSSEEEYVIHEEVFRLPSLDGLGDPEKNKHVRYIMLKTC